ncbi:hypothetical protein PUMCH_003922 [Australozyma saopauloensis]|uniref:Uncharacterized protein n=1 Tax=Australozyma saopauloensis TaxID=291208 RepID=A0AAX4HD81_9ASCO|nr:hypothetical protein PUMCH_003922 [[Candida] saopauloensis]
MSSSPPVADLSRREGINSINMPGEPGGLELGLGGIVPGNEPRDLGALIPDQSGIIPGNEPRDLGVLVPDQGEIVPFDVPRELDVVAPGQDKNHPVQVELASVSGSLQNSINPFYKDWDNDINELIWVSNLEAWNRGLDAEAYQALCQATLTIGLAFLNSISKHEKGESIKLHLMLKMRDGELGAWSTQPKTWVVTAYALRYNLYVYRDWTLQDWLPGAPEAANDGFQKFTEKLFELLDGRLEGMVKMYQVDFQGAWLVFAIRLTYAFPKVRRAFHWFASGFSLSVVCAIATFTMNFTKFVENDLTKWMWVFIGLLVIFFVLSVMACANGLWIYRIATVCSSKQKKDKRDINLAIATESKQQWIHEIFDTNSTWAFWRHFNLYTRNHPRPTVFLRTPGAPHGVIYGAVVLGRLPQYCTWNNGFEIEDDPADKGADEEAAGQNP